jgi:hypothetical protein
MDEVYHSTDTASSVEEPALKDFDFFLQNLTVEQARISPRVKE